MAAMVQAAGGPPARDYYDDLGDFMEKHPPGLGSGPTPGETPACGCPLAVCHTSACVDRQEAVRADPFCPRDATNEQVAKWGALCGRSEDFSAINAEAIKREAMMARGSVSMNDLTPSGPLDAIGILTRDRDEWKRRALAADSSSPAVEVIARIRRVFNNSLTSPYEKLQVIMGVLDSTEIGTTQKGGKT
ncbi:hypothetical protein [Acidithiobacillus sp.]|uniref:hypothetical protein n=1 Tax=Acidithiobacillus sp. TaxID=1872118 RepID=UPI00258E5E7A|nr:hypothetical protein [Acidithiobacillus sp.]MDD5374438.1 hypothetical protein [Acidithiobacillus sp.]